MYSDPLITKNPKNNNPIAVGEPVDFEAEIRKLKEMLHDLEQEVLMRVEIATSENLEKLINKSPSILHLICHGDYNKKT